MKRKNSSLVFGLSFGERYLVASLFYAGLSFVLIATVPESERVFAQAGGCTHTVTITDEQGTHTEVVPGCEASQVCCGGSCISSGQGCCNGVVYHTATQGCCNGVVYNLETQGCCNGGVYDDDTHHCCDNGDVLPNDTCCIP